METNSQLGKQNPTHCVRPRGRTVATRNNGLSVQDPQKNQGKQVAEQWQVSKTAVESDTQGVNTRGSSEVVRPAARGLSIT